MVHKRSKAKLELRDQERAAVKFLHETSFNDNRLAETICTVDQDMISYHLTIQFGGCNPLAVPSAERGLVLMDSYGRGTLQ